MEEELEKQCNYLRNRIRALAGWGLALKEHKAFQNEESFVGQHGEMIANIMLSYRHLEDARMHLGKVMQQIGGVSILDVSSAERQGILDRIKV